MNHLDIINKDLIIIDSYLETKEEAIENIGQLLFDNHRIVNSDLFIKDMYRRENEMSTSMGLGIAIPHAQSKHVTESSLIFIKLKKPIKWDEDFVEMIFGIAVPKDNKNNQHLKILSTLARNLMKKEFRNKLIQSTTKETVLKTLKQINL